MDQTRWPQWSSQELPSWIYMQTFLSQLLMSFKKKKNQTLNEQKTVPEICFLLSNWDFALIFHWIPVISRNSVGLRCLADNRSDDSLMHYDTALGTPTTPVTPTSVPASHPHIAGFPQPGRCPASWYSVTSCHPWSQVKVLLKNENQLKLEIETL